MAETDEVQTWIQGGGGARLIIAGEGVFERRELPDEGRLEIGCSSGAQI